MENLRVPELRPVGPPPQPPWHLMAILCPGHVAGNLLLSEWKGKGHEGISYVPSWLLPCL